MWSFGLSARVSISTSHGPCAKWREIKNFFAWSPQCSTFSCRMLPLKLLFMCHIGMMIRLISYFREHETSLPNPARLLEISKSLGHIWRSRKAPHNRNFVVFYVLKTKFGPCYSGHVETCTEVAIQEVGIVSCEASCEPVTTHRRGSWRHVQEVLYCFCCEFAATLRLPPCRTLCAHECKLSLISEEDRDDELARR